MSAKVLVHMSSAGPFFPRDEWYMRLALREAERALAIAARLGVAPRLAVLRHALERADGGAAVRPVPAEATAPVG